MMKSELINVHSKVCECVCVSKGNTYLTATFIFMFIYIFYFTRIVMLRKYRREEEKSTTSRT